MVEFRVVLGFVLCVAFDALKQICGLVRVVLWLFSTMFRWVYCGLLCLVVWLLRVGCYGDVLFIADLLVFVLFICGLRLVLLWFAYCLCLTGVL